MTASSRRTVPARSAPGWPIMPDRIELHLLPSYSPELNPDELVNADLNRSLPMHSRAQDQAQLARATRRFFHRRQRQPHVSSAATSAARTSATSSKRTVTERFR